MSSVIALQQFERESSLDFDAALVKLRQFVNQNPLKPHEYDLVSRSLKGFTPKAYPHSFESLKVAIISDRTTASVSSAIRVGLFCEGFFAEIYEAPFNAYRQELLNPLSETSTFKPDLLIAAFSFRAWGEGCLSFDKADARVKATELLDLLHAFSQKHRTTVFLHIPPITLPSLRGIADLKNESSAITFYKTINQFIRDHSRNSLHLLDTESLAMRVGLENWEDPRYTYHGKYLFSPTITPKYAQLFRALVRTVFGKPKKCIILDLDNTLWGGVIGDCGLHGIKLGADEPESEAYQAFCEYILALKQSGIILAVCSKNDIANAQEVFEQHPDMPLIMEDFSAFMCNWENKADNIKQIAHRLNIDPLSIVFIDDNPAEIELVKTYLPEVTSITLPKDPAEYISCVENQHLFDVPILTQEDLQRSEQYQAIEKAQALRESSADLDSYLEGLDMSGDFHVMSPEEIDRVVQLESRTNQFNMTTLRLNKEHLDYANQSPDFSTFTTYLSDRFTRHGLVSSICTYHENHTLYIYSWLMSCRVFSRGLEYFVFNKILEHSRLSGIIDIKGFFMATAKNRPCAQLYEKVGLSESALDIPKELKGYDFEKSFTAQVKNLNFIEHKIKS